MDEANSVSSGDEANFPVNLVVFSPSELRTNGLRLVNHAVKRIKKAKTKRNNERFSGHFGASPAVLCRIIQDLQTTETAAAKIEPQEFNLGHFLMAMHHLKRCPTDLEQEPIFDIDCMQGRNAVWFYVEKVRQLKCQKMVWPADNFGSDSVTGKKSPTFNSSPRFLTILLSSLTKNDSP